MSFTLSHTGVVVDNLAVAMDRYSKRLGLEWAAPVENRAIYRADDGDHEVALGVTYSAGTGHHVELIEQKQGSLFEAPDGFRAHHLGFWVDDLQAATDELVRDGHRMVFYNFDAEGKVYGCSFLEPPDGGLLIELLDERRRPDVEAWCLGGALGSRSF